MRPVRLLAAPAVVALVAAAPFASASTAAPAETGYSFAVIGDVPYGADQVAAFPSWIEQIDADRQVHFTVHVGDIKNGSSRCDDAYLEGIRDRFESFDRPLVYSPGDNEWTDCHRVNNGAYDPLERLGLIRELFYPEAGRTLGEQEMRVQDDAAAGFPENVTWRRAGVSMAAVHVVGSNNGLEPWTGLGRTEPTQEQVAEEEARMDSSIATMRASFDSAKRHRDGAVTVFLQADMFDPSYQPTWHVDAFTPFVRALAEESRDFDGNVYLVNGDSHAYNDDRPLATGSSWLDVYGVDAPADNLRRVTVDGSNNNTDWLKTTVRRHAGETTLSWQQVPYGS